MADETKKPVGHDVPGLTGTPLVDITDIVTNVTADETVKVEDFKTPPVKVTRTKTPKPTKTKYQPFKW